MATWIAHLRIAEQVSKHLRGEELQYFLIGSIAPDSGMLNPDKKSYTPPEQISHFVNRSHKKWKRENLHFYRTYLKECSFFTDRKKAFRLGYFYHLLIDDLWGYYIYRPAKKKYADELKKNPLFPWEWKKDWYWLDHAFLEEHPDWNIWELFQKTEYTDNYLPFYKTETISSKLKEIKQLYSRDGEWLHPDKYLSKTEMDRFVSVAVFWLKRCSSLLIPGKEYNTHSVLSLLEQRYDSFRHPAGNLNRDYSLIKHNLIS